MKIKRLRSISNSLSDMVTSSRLHNSFDMIIDNGIEEISIDLLGDCVPKYPRSLPVAEDITTWFGEQIIKEKIDISEVESAVLTIEFDYKAVATNLERVALIHIASHSSIVALGTKIEAKSYGKVWHNRTAA